MTLLPLFAVVATDLDVAQVGDRAAVEWSVASVAGIDRSVEATATAADSNGAPRPTILASSSAGGGAEAPAPAILHTSNMESIGAAVPLQETDASQDGEQPASFWEQAKSTKWRFAAAAGAITATGFANWDWGSSRFRFNSEGWFGKDTASLGMDKLGHAYSSYVLTEFLTDGIDRGTTGQRSYTAAALAMGLMTYIEIFDGFSAEHGFSHEDLVVDAAGAAFSIARRTIPGLRDKVDFRLLYIPSRSTWRALSCFPEPHCDKDGVAVRSPITDYSGQRYLLALKLAGFEGVRNTPLRLVELHGGYYARGFTKEEEDRGDPLRRRLFVGVGLNVGELLFPSRPRSAIGRGARSLLEYLQVPYTAVHTE